MLTIADQAIAAIQEAKTQEAVNQALETALEQINKLEAAQPEKPAQPEQPAEPENPVQPEKPAQPEKPVQPETPAQPEKPAQPENPAQPETPAQPEKPAQPETPAQPEKPITSSSPEEGVKDLVFTLPSLEIVNKVVPFKTIRRENPQLDKGKEQVLSEGKDGLLVEYVEVDGDNRKVLQTEATPAQDRVIEVGSKQSSVGTEAPPVVTLPEYVLPRETEKPAPAVTDNSSAKDEKAPVTATVKEDKERLLPATGEQEASAFLFLAAITSILSLLIFQKNFKD